MTVWEALVLGFVQGVTEFLPVSSSGHLVIGQALLDVRIPGVAFEVAVHAATLLSVLLVYRERVGGLVLGALKGDRGAWRYLGLLALATLPAMAVGLGAGPFIEALFDAPAVAGGSLLVTGAFLWTARRALARGPSGEPGAGVALLMGLAQAFAIIPGISRSGATVVAGLWLGVGAEEAAAFSFLMAVPAIVGAAVLELPTLSETGIGLPASTLLAGGIVAAVTGILAIRTFVAMLRRKSFHRFGPYCVAVGAAFLLFLAIWG
ncbi:MAG: undecaprenyl-diphosphate phosphatase [Longimicrobiales bacterium]